jgi:thiol-disulfide isomerase/thioredoxin
MDSFVIRAVVLLMAVLLASAFGVTLRRRAGRAREVTGGAVLTAEDLAAPLGQQATFVQFSSPVCAPCRAVRRVLDRVVASQPGLRHVEIDASQRLDLARRLGILRTPTVLVLDHDGLVARRISGVLTADQARAAVPELIGRP